MGDVMSNIVGDHGAAGARERNFSRLLPETLLVFDEADLKALAEGMIGNVGEDASNEPDGEENLLVPAGYTYFGQFIDHDLTFDTTSSFNNPNFEPTNLRSPRLDLDCVYGAGPDDQPYLYANQTEAGLRRGASLLLGESLRTSPGRLDLLRVGSGPLARAVIGDPRNDENSIVCNIQIAFISFHNAVVNFLGIRHPDWKDKQTFVAARKLVRWTYQQIIVHDYLKRIIEPATYETFMLRLSRQGEGAFQLYKPKSRGGIPLEFSGAAYRFGHSMVRTGYKLNEVHKSQKIFTPGEGIGSLIGFGRLPEDHWIDWRRFFPEQNRFPAGGARPLKNDDTSEHRLQWAYRIDTALVDPLKNLPFTVGEGNSLADLNLRRGNLFHLVSGQTIAHALGVSILDDKYLVMRNSPDGEFGFAPIPGRLLTDTPLWFYVLAEAQRPLVDMWLSKSERAGGRAGVVLDGIDLLEGLPGSDGERHGAPVTQLGPVGGMILMETFFGLLLADVDSYLSIVAVDDKALLTEWLAEFCPESATKPNMWKLVEYAGLTDI
jgi:hypothetical protein